MIEERDQLDALCRQAVALVRSVPGQVSRVRVQAGDLSVDLQWPAPGDAPAAVTATATAPADEAPDDGTFTLRAPMLGTFHRRPQPDAPPFVDVGDAVEPGQQLAIVEAMKLMYPLTVDRPARVVEILVPDGAPVEYDQGLIVLDMPSRT